MARLCSSRFERAARKLGWTRIAGLDEAGRGALFGPVVSGAVILNPKRRIVGLDDSKKLMPERRTALASRIREHALAWAVAEVDAARIDAWNIYEASRQAMTAASNLAKTHRDARMAEWDAAYPQYGLARHKGYATPDHLEALRRFGPTRLHRFSFAPVREAACWSVGATQAHLPLELLHS